MERITIRIPDDLMKHKPKDMSPSDWIREALHLWILEKEGIKKEILVRINEALKDIDTFNAKINQKDLNDALKTMTLLRSKLDSQIGRISRSASTLDISALKQNLLDVAKAIEGGFLYKQNLYLRDANSHRPYSRDDDWEDEEDDERPL